MRNESVLSEPKVEIRKQSAGRHASIEPFDGSSFTYISIHQSADIESGDLDSAEVNWPSLGAVSPETARGFAKAILRAADLADEWDGDIPEKNS